MPEAQRDTRHRDWRAVATTTELEEADRKIVEIDGESVGIFMVDGEYVAILNVCPHEFAPVCLGRVGGTTLTSAPGEWIWGREGEILSCPWHGWEFELRTGKALFGRRPRLRLFPVKVEGDTILVSLVGSYRPSADPLPG